MRVLGGDGAPLFQRVQLHRQLARPHFEAAILSSEGYGDTDPLKWTASRGLRSQFRAINLFIRGVHSPDGLSVVPFY